MTESLINFDFSKIDDLPDDSLEMFFNVADLGLDIMTHELDTNAELMIKSFWELELERQQAIIEFYTKLKEVYLKFEYYERIPEIIKILEKFQK